MATSMPTVPSTQASQQLCDYCHQKPKYSNHLYCSKTCAGQAATLCNHCHKKPKFQNFEYCGKNCAAQANPGGKSRNAGAAASGPQATGNNKPSYPKANNFNNQKQAAPAFDPIQLAKLVAQHIPQVQAMLAPANPAGQSTAPLGGGYAPQVIPPTAYNAATNNPFLNVTNQASYQTPPAPVAQNAMTNGAVHISAASSQPPPSAAQQLHLSAQPSTINLECLIPGCGQPVHVDAKGVKSSDYCSMRHREEAVTSGLVSPCIMCLTLPQSENDYFCSRVCREESLSKQLDHDYDDCSDSE
ncbi:hypothetical protein B0H34DRAFT_732421 [Crassisporium funariophilum]|nr:hypothetical protein B0H34DRAFT_732421 [Crassisporium funariophilum]